MTGDGYTRPEIERLRQKINFRLRQTAQMMTPFKRKLASPLGRGMRAFHNYPMMVSNTSTSRTVCFLHESACAAVGGGGAPLFPPLPLPLPLPLPRLPEPRLGGVGWLVSGVVVEPEVASVDGA